MINVSNFRIMLSYIGCVVACLLPLILFFVDESVRYSISQYVKNPSTYWIFKISLIVISTAFLTKVKYIPASILLWLILLLDVTTYPIIHNISALTFFIFMITIMYIEKSFLLAKLMIISLLLIYFNLFWFEVCGIILISIHQIKTLKRIENIQETDYHLFI